ncbi:DUF1330 domain-containing protein [Seonamhaeicola marinus]|uniref:DUF1330 domain-containing protein n=1 Tax=Seonamhaeicola marinus TaxID=1912246 RepID=A0A5D0HJI0_9FLAO|nr:hypothetical protein [Seonamhaeicola marinus]TYA71395.1 hypothetical protein FUA24_17580 [Seonamhaeicola marinus]
MKYLKVITSIALVTTLFYAYNSIAQNSNINSKNKNKMETQNEEIVNVALIYLKESEKARFEEYKKKGGAILEKYGGKIERIIQPKMLAKGNLELPDEIHFASYPSIEVFNKFNEDPEFVKIRNEYAVPAIKDISIFTSRNTDFEFKKETGDKTKTYGVALIYFNNGQKYAKLFEEYHDKVCTIMPEFGTHFERFIAPFQSKGNIKQPDEIHRFYFDSMEGLQEMETDERMKSLFPKRDASLKNLYFFIGEASL